MGRMKYSETERIQMIATFLKATQQIINEEGIEQISIRKVARIAGFNSATIYLYFQDVDELITVASMGYLEEYCRELEENAPQITSAYEIYLYTWELFCRFAFKSPQIYYRLFYHTHSKPLNESVAKYYQLFPNALAHCSSTIWGMLHSGSLEKRNYQVLHPLVKEGLIEEGSVDLINDLTLCYFRKILESVCENPDLNREEQTKKVLDAVCFLLKK